MEIFNCILYIQVSLERNNVFMFTTLLKVVLWSTLNVLHPASHVISLLYYIHPYNMYMYKVQYLIDVQAPPATNIPHLSKDKFTLNA